MMLFTAPEEMNRLITGVEVVNPSQAYRNPTWLERRLTGTFIDRHPVRTILAAFLIGLDVTAIVATTEDNPPMIDFVDDSYIDSLEACLSLEEGQSIELSPITAYPGLGPAIMDCVMNDPALNDQAK